MKLIHSLKGKKPTRHEILIDADAALLATAFQTYTTVRGDETTHIALGWTLKSTNDKKYLGHSFELMVEPHEIARAIEALTIAMQRFAVVAVPIPTTEATDA